MVTIYNYNTHCLISMIRIRINVGIFFPRALSRNFSNFVGLPFTISRDDANKTFFENKRFLEKSTNDKNKKDLILYDPNNTVKECYVPFHSADISNIQSSFSGRYGIDRTEWYWTIEYNGKHWVPVQKSRTVTDWWTTTGTIGICNYPFGTSDTQIYAGFKYPRRQIESVLIKNDITKINTLTDAMLVDPDKKRRIVYPHDMNVSFALEKIMHKLYLLEKNRASNYILKKHNADHAEVNDLNIHLEIAIIVLKSYHLPAYIYSYTQDEIALHKIVDGYSGVYNGDYALSPIKLFILGSLIGAAIPLFGTTLPAATVIGRMLLSGVLTGTPVSLFGWYRHIARSRTDTAEINDDVEHNKSFQETDEDIKRRKDAEQFNGSSFNDDDRYRYLNVDDIIGEKLTMLGMDPSVTPTETDLKARYYEMMKKWHPDTYNGDKKLAHKMTYQINEAYQTLSKIIKNKN
jgi:hypothetical protein